MTKLKAILTGLLVTAAILASLLVQRRSQARFHASDTLMRQQEDQLAELAAENQRLSNLVVRAKATNATGEDRTVELAKLRAEAEGLRHQSNQLAKQLAENRRLAGAQLFSRSDHNLLEHNQVRASTLAGGP